MKIFRKKLKVICPMLFTLFSRLSLADTSQITVQAFAEEFFFVVVFEGDFSVLSGTQP